MCAALALAPAALTFADELSETGEFLDGVAAIVNEGVVLKSQLREQMRMIVENANAAGQSLPPIDTLQDIVLERLIVTEVQLQRADRMGLQISDQALNEYIANIAEAQDIAFEDMPEELRKDGIDYATFRSQLRDDITVNELRRMEVSRSINVSENPMRMCESSQSELTTTLPSRSTMHISTSLSLMRREAPILARRSST